MSWFGIGLIFLLGVALATASQTKEACQHIPWSSSPDWLVCQLPSNTTGIEWPQFKNVLPLLQTKCSLIVEPVADFLALVLQLVPCGGKELRVLSPVIKGLSRTSWTVDKTNVTLEWGSYNPQARPPLGLVLWLSIKKF